MDSILTALKQHDLKMGVAHQWRTAAPGRQTIRDVKAEKYGKLLRIRVRPKDDNRGGGEDLWVLGTHVFDLTNHLAGYPLWCQGYARQNGELVTAKHVKPGNEGIGLLAGDNVGATYALPNEVLAHFRSIHRGAGLSLIHI